MICAANAAATRLLAAVSVCPLILHAGCFSSALRVTRAGGIFRRLYFFSFSPLVPDFLGGEPFEDLSMLPFAFAANLKIELEGMDTQ